MSQHPHLRTHACDTTTLPLPTHVSVHVSVRTCACRTLLCTYRFPEASFDLYFLATLTPDEAHAHAHGTLPPLWCWPRATLELTHNYGTETACASASASDSASRVYWCGNDSPYEGFACVGFTVSHGDAFMKAAAHAGVRVLSPWNDSAVGGAYGVLAEPSTGYAIRITQRPHHATGTDAAASAAWSVASPHDYAPRLLDTVLRVSDVAVTAAFYREHFHANIVARHECSGVLPGGTSSSMVTYVATSCHGGRVDPTAASTPTPDWQYASLLTGYDSAIGLVTDPALAAAGRKPCSGNVDPGRGYGHVGFLVDDLTTLCATLEANGVVFKKRPSEGRMRGIAFVLDPDGYWIEMIQRGWNTT